MKTYEEWRVTGTWHGEPYAFTWSPMRVKHPEGYEQGARAFVAQVGDYDWSDGPHLHKRTVTVTEWEPA